MGVGIVLILLIVAIVFGLAAQAAITPSWHELEWLFVATGAAAGAFVASELLGPLSAWGPEIDGLVLAPAAIALVVVGSVIAAAGAAGVRARKPV
jgi:hypothetical protein